MNWILNKFGITRELINSAYNYEEMSLNQGNSNFEDIKRAIEILAPVSCGIPLIRIGASGDGGYLIPNDVEGIQACFSPGTNNSKYFEDDLALKYGIKSYMCDFSSDIEKFRTPIIHNMQFFEKKFLDIEANDKNIDINQWINTNSTANSDLILQMDIEGAEYRNLLHATEDNLSSFRIIVLELHALHLLSKVQFLKGVFFPTLNKILKSFKCVHAHPNNCCGIQRFNEDLTVPKVLELTFLRNDRFKSTAVTVQLPHPLDAINVKSKPPLHISDALLKNADPLLSELNGLRQTTAWLEKRVIQLESKITSLT